MTDIKQNSNSFIFYHFFAVIEELIQHSENFFSSLNLLGLSAFFLHQLHKWNKLIKKRNFNITTFLD